MADSKHYDSTDLTQCGICLLTLQDPKALPCLHSFCSKCLTQWAKGKSKITCPLCVQEFEIPKGGVSTFRTNFFINTLKERQENARTIQSHDTVVPCASCASLESKVEGYCSSCGGFICGDCVGIHCKIKSLSYHKVIPYVDLQSGKVDIRNLHQDKHCKVHREQVLRFFCETCGELICRDCTVVDHPAASHTLVNLENVTKVQKIEIEQLTRHCKEAQEKIEEALKELDSVSVELGKNATTAEGEIDEAFHKALRLLEDTRNRLKGEVKTVLSERKKRIDAEKEEIQLQQTRLMTTLQMATEVVETGSDYDLALNYSSLKTNLTTLRDMKPARSTKNLGDVSFKPVRQPTAQDLGSVLSRCRRVKEGVGIWKMVRAFGKDGVGKLSLGRGAAVTENCDIIITDRDGKAINVYNTSGDFKSKLNVPKNSWNVAASQDHEEGRMFVTNKTTHVSVYDVEGNLKQQFPAKSPKNVSSYEQESQLWGLAFDNQNNLLVGNKTQKYISKHRLNGTHITSFKVSIEPWYITVSAQDKIIISFCDTEAVHIVDENGTHLHTLKPPQGLSPWKPYGICSTSENQVYIANHQSSGSIHSYSTETGDYIGCLTKDVTLPTGLALMDDENKLIVAEDNSVKIFQLQ